MLNHQQNYSLECLSSDFDKLTSDNKNSTLKALEFILQLNSNIHLDPILIRQAFQQYPNNSNLESNRTLDSCQAFFRYMGENQQSIEQRYLKESNDQQFVDKAQQEDEEQYNYLLNKNNISKFIRDEATHYHTVLEKYLESSGQDEKVIKTLNIHHFFKDLFTSHHIAIIKDNALYLNLPEETISFEVGNTLHSYAQATKDISAEAAQQSFLITEQEVLDFLTFWLKQQAANHLFVLYARTKTRIEQECKILLNTSPLRVPLHPSRMTKDQLEQLEQEQASYLINQDMSSSVDKNSKAKRNRGQQLPNYSFFSLAYNRPEERPEQLPTVQHKRELTREEMLDRVLISLFEFGCKSRYKINKNSTFDQLEYELTNMNLEKFMNFCNFFEFPSIISRDTIIDHFKVCALNRRTIDFPRFQKLIKKLVQTDQRVATHLLNKLKFQMKRKQSQIKHNQKVQGKLSAYKFQLRPVNGKDITTIQKELAYRKLEKQIEKQEKDHAALLKKERFQNARHKTRSISSLGSSSQRMDGTIVKRHQLEELGFNPEKYLVEEKDQLWDAYEAKIWRRDDKNTLESILSKRISRGNQIINQIHSQRSLLHE